MGKLRERLRLEAPELFEALERSWDIARDEWLPALGVKSDSFNSYPHIRNLEQYLDQVFGEFEPLEVDAQKEFITPIEIYIILCAILFHDIGRIRSQQGESKSIDHAIHSRDIINDESAGLGIVSTELAKCIAEICAEHECKDWKWGEKVSKLTITVIDPYGEIRVRWLASLLILVDHLDGAFTRVVPMYLRSTSQSNIIGAFRSLVKGVYVDGSRQIIRTVISNLQKEGSCDDGRVNYSYQKISHFNEKAIDILKPELLNSLKDKFCEEEIPLELSDAFSKYSGDLTRLLKVDEFSVSDCLVAFHAYKINDKDKNYQWTKKKLLALIMGNVYENAFALNGIQGYLAENSIYLKSWVIEYDEHLFNNIGQEFFEPIFSRDYLERVIDSMWTLSSSVIFAGNIPYSTLASHVRDPNIKKIKTAVKRISIVSRDKNVIWAGQTNWKWNGNGDEQFNDKELKDMIKDRLRIND